MMLLESPIQLGGHHLSGYPSCYKPHHLYKIEIGLFLAGRRTELSYITLNRHKFKNIIFNAI